MRLIPVFLLATLVGATSCRTQRNPDQMDSGGMNNNTPRTYQQSGARKANAESIGSKPRNLENLKNFDFQAADIEQNGFHLLQLSTDASEDISYFDYYVCQVKDKDSLNEFCRPTIQNPGRMTFSEHDEVDSVAGKVNVFIRACMRGNDPTQATCGEYVSKQVILKENNDPELKKLFLEKSFYENQLRLYSQDTILALTSYRSGQSQGLQLAQQNGGDDFEVVVGNLLSIGSDDLGDMLVKTDIYETIKSEASQGSGMNLATGTTPTTGSGGNIDELFQKGYVYGSGDSESSEEKSDDDSESFTWEKAGIGIGAVALMGLGAAGVYGAFTNFKFLKKVPGVNKINAVKTMGDGGLITSKGMKGKAMKIGVGVAGAAAALIGGFLIYDQFLSLNLTNSSDANARKNLVYQLEKISGEIESNKTGLDQVNGKINALTE